MPPTRHAGALGVAALSGGGGAATRAGGGGGGGVAPSGLAARAAAGALGHQVGCPALAQRAHRRRSTTSTGACATTRAARCAAGDARPAAPLPARGCAVSSSTIDAKALSASSSTSSRSSTRARAQARPRATTRRPRPRSRASRRCPPARAITSCCARRSARRSRSGYNWVSSSVFATSVAVKESAGCATRSTPARRSPTPGARGAAARRRDGHRGRAWGARVGRAPAHTPARALAAACERARRGVENRAHERRGGERARRALRRVAGKGGGRGGPARGGVPFNRGGANYQVRTEDAACAQAVS